MPPGAGSDLDLGNGRRWGLVSAVTRTMEKRNNTIEKNREADALRKLGKALLAQALQCSDRADIEFKFPDGSPSLRGHSGVLVAVSEFFQCLYRSGMSEVRHNKFDVPPGISVASFKAFLEFVYLGRCGPQCVLADGRELVVLAELYDVPGLVEWLLEDGIGAENVLGAYEFALVNKEARSDVLERCLEFAKRGLVGFDRSTLRGVGVEAVGGLLSARLVDFGAVSRKIVHEGVEFVQRWVLANGGARRLGARAIGRVVGMLDLGVMSKRYLAEEVAGSGLLRGRELEALMAEADGRFDRALDVESVFGFGDTGKRLFHKMGLRQLAVHGRGDRQRVAGVDAVRKRVLVFGVETGKLLATAGDVRGEGMLMRPIGCAFNAGGELFVSDEESDRILVFGTTGSFVRAIGAHIRLSRPRGLAFTPGGDLVIADSGNARVQVVREDGSLVRSIGSRAGKGELYSPFGVAVGPDGEVVVSDLTRGNRANRVLRFSAGGEYEGEIHHVGRRGTRVRNPVAHEDRSLREDRPEGTEGSYPPGPPQQVEMPAEVRGVAVAAGGEVLAADPTQHFVCVYGKEGKRVQAIGGEGRMGELQHPHGVCVDWEGRVFVGCTESRTILMLS
eukprot:CAMPEP_0169478146 /NCGR_PEP_ID=MMETSP1042-20121227/28315_1 /TAXON_ID=464988 /ORGANISM="Hemiselmis andersenii, Strain CCMP1180" /LENGTH=617 /DNA_ID=CAMNT_0009592585 /DNA_START=124 /DNA_END=1977 /DNA_ORIENTATION=-